VRIKQADEFAEGLRGTLEAFKAQGFSQERIIAELNNSGVKAPRSGMWTSCTQLRNVIRRLERIA